MYTLIDDYILYHHFLQFLCLSLFAEYICMNQSNLSCSPVFVPNKPHPLQSLTSQYVPILGNQYPKVNVRQKETHQPYNIIHNYISITELIKSNVLIQPLPPAATQAQQAASLQISYTQAC